MRAPLRRLLLTTHLWLGVAAAPFLLVLGVTGAVLAFDTELDDATNGRLTRADGGGPALPVDTLVARVQAAYPGAVLDALLTYDDAHAYQLVVHRPPPARPSPIAVRVDQHTGRVLGTESERDTWVQTVHSLHTRLLAGERGSAVVGVAAAALVYLGVTGLVLWWPGKVLAVRRNGSGRRVVLDLHRATGAWAWPLLMLFGLTGMAIHWQGGAETFFRVVLPTPARAAARVPNARVPNARVPDARVPNGSCGAAVSPDSLLAAASAALPGARPTMLRMPTPKDPTARVTLRYADDHTPAGRSLVVVDGCTGRVARAESVHDRPASYRLAHVWARAWHTGDAGGLFTRVLAALFSLSLPVMASTGPLIWWQRRRAQAMKVRDDV